MVSSNNLINNLNASVMNDEWMNNIYGKERTEQKAALKQMFNVIDDANIDESEKKKLSDRAEVIQSRITEIENNITGLNDKIQNTQEKIDNITDKVTNLITTAGKKSSELEETQKSNVKTCISDVFAMYQRGTIQRNQISNEIRTRIRNLSFKDKTALELQSISEQISSKQNEIAGYADQVKGLTSDIKNWQGQLGVNKTALSFINKSIGQINNPDATYTNNDYDTKSPIYSIEKLAIANDIFKEFGVAATNSAKIEEGAAGAQETPKTLDEVKEKYKEQIAKSSAAQKSNSYSIKNGSITALNEAVNNGMLKDLLATGSNSNDIAKFLVTNFSGAKLSLKNDKLVIPYGHDQVSKSLYTNINQTIQKANQNNGFLGALDTTNDAGNTVNSNDQLKSLDNNFSEILFKLGNCEPKFSFKEAMYLLFNQNNGVFKNTGITYDINQPVDANGEPQYFIGTAGDRDTAQLYKDIALKIKDIWGVANDKPTTQLQVIGQKQAVKRTDPLSFSDGSKEYSFVIDRNKNDLFDSQTEFVGGSDSSSWLDDMKTFDLDGNGIIEGNELDNVNLLVTNYQDNANVSNNEKGFMRETSTHINYSFASAKNLGITNINLENLENNVNQSTNEYDVNGSEKFKDGFTFTMNGKEISAERKDDTQEFMNAVYSNSYGRNMHVGFSEDTVDSEIEANFSGQDIAEIDKIATDVNTLNKNIDDLNQTVKSAPGQIKTMFNQSLARIDEDETLQLTKATNKARALNSAKGWDSTSNEIKKIAQERGITIDMEQAKGIYNASSAITASQIVDKCEQLSQKEQQITQNAQNSKLAWEALALCMKNSLSATASEINEVISENNLQDAQSIYEFLKEKNQQA